MNHAQTCLMCSSTEIHSRFFGKTELHYCNNCGIYFNANFPNKNELTEYYTNNYQISEIDYIKTENRRLFRLPEQINLISKIIQFKKPPSHILDIGCDKGYFLDEARRYGYDVAGVEPSETASNYCKNIGINIYEKLENVDKKFDIITLWHSLEHFSIPLYQMNKVNELLNEDGIVAIRVPAFDCFYRNLFGRNWIWFQPDVHLFHFTEKSLISLFKFTGFDIIFQKKQKPNNRMTGRMKHLTNAIFKKSFKSKTTTKEKLVRLYENLTAVEWFVIAKKKNL